MQKSLIYLVLAYATKHCKKSQFTGKELYELQEAAQQYYIDNMPPDTEARKNKILEKYNFTREQWDHILNTSAMCFVDTHTPEMEACHKDIQALYKSFPYINSIALQDNYFFALLSVQIRRKNPEIKRERINGVYHYSLINPGAQDQAK